VNLLISLLVTAGGCSDATVWADLLEAQEVIDTSRKAPGRKRPQIVSPFDTRIPKLHILPIHTTPENKEYCIITYASWDPPYPELVEQLLNRLPEVFCGHLLYRIGGWPGMELGCLAHSQVPYAFKVCAFVEAYRLGYRKILWLDALAMPLRPLLPLFEQIEKAGCIYRFADKKLLRRLVTQELLDDFQLSRNKIRGQRQIASGILGLNLADPTIFALLNDWHASVERKKSFYTLFPEEVSLSILLHQYNLANIPSDNLVTFDPSDPEESFFLFDYSKKVYDN